MAHSNVNPDFVCTADNTKLFYRSWGDGRSAVVFSSGWALNSDMWAYQMVALTQAGLRCVAYDRRGHGRSSDPGRGYDYDTLADDLAAVLDGLDVEGVTLVGHSMANGELVRYLTRHGARRIRRMVLLAPAGMPFRLKTTDNPGGIDASVTEAIRRDRLTRDFPKWIDDNAEPYFVPGTSPGIVEWTKRMMMQASLQAVVECHRIFTCTDFRAELPTVRVPTLVIHGDKDVSAPLELTGRPTAEAIPGAVLSIYEGAPHGLYITHQERLNRDLLGFAQPQG